MLATTRKVARNSYQICGDMSRKRLADRTCRELNPQRAGDQQSL